MTGQTTERCRKCRYGIPVTVGMDYEILFICTFSMTEHRERKGPTGDGCGEFISRKDWREAQRRRWESEY